MSNVWFILYDKKYKCLIRPTTFSAAEFYNSLSELIFDAKLCDSTLPESQTQFSYFLVCIKPYIAIKV